MPGMLVLLDRAFDSNAFLAEIAATGAVLLARTKSTRIPLVLRHLPDRSCLSPLDRLDVRIVEAEVAITGNRSYTRAHFVNHAQVVTPGTYR